MSVKEYFINKLTFRESERLIKDVSLYESDSNVLSELGTQDRDFLLRIANSNYQLTEVYPDPNNKDKWERGNIFKFDNGYFHWGKQLPLNSTMHKTFVSYYHDDDQEYKERFERLFDDLIVSKSVEKGDIDSDISDEYIKKIIQSDYLTDTSVIVVLVGANTKCRKHVDWEIAGAISTRVGGNSGLLGILLPNHPDYGTGKYLNGNLPLRLDRNIQTGYAKLYEWTEDRVEMQEWIELAFKSKNDIAKIINKGIPQMQEDTNE